MKKYGFTKLYTQDSQASAQKQVTGSTQLIHTGISALIVSPQEPKALPATIAAAHGAKIPVIVGDVGAAGDYDAFILSDNYKGGQLAAQFIVKALSKQSGVSEVGLISLLPTTSVNGPRTKGFTDFAKKNASKIKVVADISGKQTLQGGYAAAKSILAAHPNVRALYCMNDSMAAGAEQALEQAGKSPTTDVVLVGFNGDSIALNLMKKGKLAADVVQDPYAQGVKAVDIAWTYLSGKTPKFTQPSTKTYSVPVALVTPGTLAAFLKHRK
jgi:ribose transport system substrate-binding protein